MRARAAALLAVAMLATALSGAQASTREIHGNFYGGGTIHAHETISPGVAMSTCASSNHTAEGRFGGVVRHLQREDTTFGTIFFDLEYEGGCETVWGTSGDVSATASLNSAYRGFYCDELRGTVRRDAVQMVGSLEGECRVRDTEDHIYLLFQAEWTPSELDPINQTVTAAELGGVFEIRPGVTT